MHQLSPYENNSNFHNKVYHHVSPFYTPTNTLLTPDLHFLKCIYKKRPTQYVHIMMSKSN